MLYSTMALLLLSFLLPLVGKWKNKRQDTMYTYEDIFCLKREEQAKTLEENKTHFLLSGGCHKSLWIPN